MLHKNIDDFQAIILSARPSPDQAGEPSYNEQKAMYSEMLKVGTAMMSRMRESINQAMTDYRHFIDDVWEAICAGKDPTPLLKTFQEKLEKMTKESWDPVFAMADEMKAEITNVKGIRGQ
ncbi:unnamed protein product [Rotaria sp. Silwood1]|nr:unnamed protein product [Rotaria sp. Silwood1]CAF3907421.1 unnamed protein product [Rotaria sp. Silwood1]CAF3930392.1 unnamed protein product [Rotaria sp. Silwood1]CAF4640918.1 unnamed protein product [Rotaria sp. Silwood1]